VGAHTLPRTRRIGPKSEIDRIFRRGHSFAGRILRVHILPNGRPESRLAISAPRKVGGAVQRNRWKRLIREAFRLNRNAIGPGFDLAVVPQVSPDGVMRPDVEDALLSALAAYRRAKR